MKRFSTKKGRMGSIFIAIIFMLVLFSSVSAAENNISEITVSPSIELPYGWFYIVLFVVLLVFGAILVMGYKADTCLNKGEMRRTIAGTFVVGFTILLLLSLFYEFRNDEIVTAYVQMTGVVIGFYFGTRSALGKQTGVSGGLSIENVKFELDSSGNPDKKITLSIRNGGDVGIRVDRIYLNGEDFDKDVQIEPQRSKKETITLNEIWTQGKGYNIKVATTTGDIAENVFLSPVEEG
ncbi:hypothetical protein V7O66_04865 [Methanolobus sp. ZRKC3]|uniref:hypothetical protein n=1 Tax=Methanolobus sp. ZRKC3 TaxID=3125786 RepID=UPI003254C225